MAKSKMKVDELKNKKRELQSELEKIEQELDDSLDKVKTDFTSKLDPAEFVKKHPVPVVGASVLLGFLAGYKSKRSIDLTSGDGMGSLLFAQLKKLATRKAIELATDYVEAVLEGSKNNIAPSKNGTVEGHEA